MSTRKTYILYYLLILLISKSYSVFSQGVAISTNSSPPHNSAILDLQSNSHGFLLPRMSTSERDAILNPTTALMIFNTTNSCLEIWTQQWTSLWCHQDTSSFSCGEIVTDIDGNTYNTIQIGNQCWFSENLKTTKYNDGATITKETNETIWANLTTESYCWYNNDSIAYFTIYGALYNWYVASSGKICPQGWRIPSDQDWKTLEMEIGMTQAETNGLNWRGTDEGRKLKSCRTVNYPLGGICNTTIHPRWNENATHYGMDNYNFNGLPAGYRLPNGPFNSMGSMGAWWATDSYDTSRALFRLLRYYNSGVHRHYYSKNYGFSIRCIKE